MFTGLIEEVGTIAAFERAGDSARITIHGPLVSVDAGRGASIAIDGMCLTVVEHSADAFSVDVMAVSLETSALTDKAVGGRVNLERATRVGDRLGGHIVQGHLDGTATVLESAAGDHWRRVRFSLSQDLAPLVAKKGSITLDGVSLTVSRLASKSESAQWFEVSLIPETLTATTLGERHEGDRVNVETDILARHVARLVELGSSQETPA